MMVRAHRMPADVIGKVREPVLFKGLAGAWPALTKWTPDFLQQIAGDRIVTVVRGDREANHPVFESMRLADFFAHCFRPDDVESSTLYLKEFDLLDELPVLLQDVDFSPLEFPDSRSYHDAWIGQRGARTGLHCDIFNNFLTHIVGRKKVTVIPPENTPDVYPSGKFDYCARLAGVNGFEPDLARFPRFARALEAGTTYILEPGDTLYIPKLWWHQVSSETPTISLAGFTVARSDRITLLAEKVRRMTHNLGLYRKGNCTCHD